MSDWPPIADVLAHYGFDLPPARAGWTPVRCQFHDDTRASAGFNVKLGGFSCLACGITGDGLKLIMEREGVSYSTACDIAGEWSGTSHPDVRGESRYGGRLSHRPRYRESNSEALPVGFRAKTLFGDT